MSDVDDLLGAQSGTDPNGSQSGTGSTDANANNGGATGGQSATPPTVEETVSRADFERIKAQLQAADQKRAEIEKAHRDLVDKDLPAQEKLQRDLQSATERAEKLESENQKLRKANAFLEDNTFSWQNPKVAQALLDSLGFQIEIDGNGEVTGLKEALKKLATDHPYLLKTQEAKPDEEPKGGTVPGNNGKAGTDTPQRKTLENRFGALRTRR
jgi:hypothetical protein